MTGSQFCMEHPLVQSWRGTQNTRQDLSALRMCVWLQAVRIELALANGTLLELTPDSNPHLWRAGQVLTSADTEFKTFLFSKVSDDPRRLLCGAQSSSSWHAISCSSTLLQEVIDLNCSQSILQSSAKAPAFRSHTRKAAIKTTSDDNSDTSLSSTNGCHNRSYSGFGAL